nr:protein S100-A7 isoform X2 [Oryctolagus cuniculus]XP_051714606.1 protein S100-A7 isoform X2 [Oryctolagus cuniculus]XP_051714607.1 protein S100-A7 isoform X2 [Oryctolagus cuniculus]
MMSNTEAERMLLDLLSLYHKYSLASGALDKSGLSKIMQEHFPTFLSAWEQKSPDFLDKLIKKEDADDKQEIGFSEFLSRVAAIVADLHDSSQGGKLSSEGQ